MLGYVITIVEFRGIQQLELTNVIATRNYESLMLLIPSVVAYKVIGLMTQLVSSLETGPDFLTVVEEAAECTLIHS